MDPVEEFHDKVGISYNKLELQVSSGFSVAESSKRIMIL